MMMKLMTLMFSVGVMAGTGSLLAEGDKSKYTLFENGFNAAGYGNVTVDHGEVEGTTVSRLRLQAGFQLFRISDVSVSLGFNKTGFYDSLVRHSEAYEDENLKYDLNGPSLSVSIFPSWPISAEFSYVLASARIKRNLSVDNDRRPEGVDADIWKTYEERIKLTGSEISLAMIFAVGDSVKLILGAGQRALKGESKIYGTDNDIQEGVPFQDVSVDESFFFFGIRGSQF